MSVNFLMVVAILACGHGTISTAQSCTLFGNTDRMERSQSSAKGLFLDLQNPAQCNGTVTAWNYCFYRIESASDINYIVDFVVYRRTGSGGNYELMETRTVDMTGSELATLNCDFKCNRIPLEESEMFVIQENDVLGACLNDVGNNQKMLDILAESVTNTLYVTDGCIQSGVDIPTRIIRRQLITSSSFALHLFVDITVSSQLHVAAISTHLTNPPTQFPGSTSMTISSHLVLATPSGAHFSSHLILPTPSNADLSSNLVLPTPDVVQPSQSNAAFSDPNLIVWGMGSGVGGAVILLLLCTGMLLSCILGRKWCKCTHHKADIDHSDHGDSSVVMTRFAKKMSTNKFYISASSDSQEMKPYRDPASTEDDLYIQLKENNLQFIPREMIEVTLLLGKGHFGVVDRGIWNDSNGMIFEVALKSVKQGASKEERVKLLQEAAIMAQFRHPNVLQSYGVVAQPDLVILVLEICHSGDLKKYLKSNYDTSSSFDNDLPSQLHSFSRDVAMGMCYLSSRGFIHRDLAARNILVTARKTCKIADFGMSRKFDGTYYMSTSVLVPVKWTAPEAITDRKYSTASDVWSYGCLLYEIWSLGRDPYEDIPTADVLQKIQSGYRDPPPPGCQGAIYQLMTECWQLDRHSRPSFKDVITVLLREDPLTQPPHISRKLQESGIVYYNTSAMKYTPAHESEEGGDVYYSFQDIVDTPKDYYNTSSYSKLNRS